MSDSPISLDLQMRIAEWRRKAAEGTLALDEMKEAIVMLRQGRVAAQNASAVAKRKAAVKVIPAAEDLLGELGDM